MASLRSHHFFSSIDWNTLWASPAPPLEAGLVKKDPHSSTGRSDGQNAWEEVSAAWDDLVYGGRDEDEMSWASDDGGIEAFKLGGVTTDASGVEDAVHHYEEEAVGPMGETRQYASSPSSSPGSSAIEQNGRGTPRPISINTHTVSAGANGSSHARSGSGSGVRFIEAASNGSPEKRPKPELLDEPPDSGTEADEDRDTVAATLDDIPMAVRTQPIDVPFVGNGIRDSYSTGSATSSSDGGSPPVGGLDAALNRGRNRAQTPIQGHGPVDEDAEWWVTKWVHFYYLEIDLSFCRRAALLMPGESVLFNATVEKSALRRRASRLLAIAGAPRRKPRELVLTDKRLVCVKHKPGGTFQLSNELWLKSADRDTDPKTSIVSAEPKGEREFVVLTVRFCLLRVAKRR